MYSKDELSSKSITELLEIAHNYGIDVNTTGSEEELIYAILDKQAEVEGMKNPLGTKRRRTRIVKKDTDRVYTVSGKEGENFDMKKNKTNNQENDTAEKTDNTAQEAQEAQASEEDMSPEEILAAMPKHRGRKSKRELELLAAAEAARQAAQQETTDAEADNLDADDAPYNDETAQEGAAYEGEDAAYEGE